MAVLGIFCKLLVARKVNLVIVEKFGSFLADNSGFVAGDFRLDLSIEGVVS